MGAVSNFVVKHRKPIIAIFLALSIFSVFLALNVKIEYDLTKFLPENSSTKKGIAIMKDEFGLNGSAQLMVKSSNLEEVLALKTKINEIDGVKAVVFIDEYEQAIQLGAFTAEQINDMHFKDGYARFVIAFDEDDYSQKTNDAVAELYKLNGNDIYLSGSAVNVYFARTGAFSDVFNIALAIIPVFFLILFLMLDTWLEPIIIIFVMTVSLVITMGSNIFMGSISFISLICLFVLLFAITMDYSIFLLHRFTEEKKTRLSLIEAMTNAVKTSFKRSFNSTENLR